MQKNKNTNSECFSASALAFRCGTGFEILFLIFLKQEQLRVIWTDLLNVLFSIHGVNWIVSLSVFAFECFDSNITSRATFPNWIVLTSNVDALHSHSIDVIVATDKKVPVRANRLRPDKRRGSDKSEISHFSSMFFISENSFRQSPITRFLHFCQRRASSCFPQLLCYPSLKPYKS